ncbi:MAG: aminotransferase class I/II-fold pyridoxal phosphate-dependent enzyme [Myxococcaceae bacterium]|nr:aminotransferase class I/II-fold pyridoxal phosphate-dependent enzyme [Myxococcaceae bacterium]
MQRQVFRPAPHIENVRYAIRNIAVEAARVEAEGKRVLYCNIGDPLRFDFATPPHLVEAVERAMRDGKNGYAPSAGLLAARTAVANDAVKRGMSQVTPGDVFITAGVSEAIDLVLTATLEPGDEVLLPCPGYPLYDAIAARLHAKAVAYHPDEANGWQPDARELESRITSKTRALVICNPNNPTGATYSSQTLAALLDVARRHQLLVLADEIYDRLLYGGTHVPMGTLAEGVALVMLNGLSKAYLCPGWRVGWLAFVNPNLTRDLARAVQRLADARLCGPAPVQHAVEPALFGSQAHIAAAMAKLLPRRDLMVKRLNAIRGVSVVAPSGAFYAMPRLELPGLQSDEQFVLKLLREEQVLFVHGEGFGQKPGTHHFRVVFLPPLEVLDEAFARFERFVARWAP